VREERKSIFVCLFVFSVEIQLATLTEVSNTAQHSKASVNSF
jgi:hypothetical protein